MTGPNYSGLTSSHHRRTALQCGGRSPSRFDRVGFAPSSASDHSFAFRRGAKQGADASREYHWHDRGEQVRRWPSRIRAGWGRVVTPSSRLGRHSSTPCRSPVQLQEVAETTGTCHHRHRERGGRKNPRRPWGARGMGRTADQPYCKFPARGLPRGGRGAFPIPRAACIG